MMMVDEEGFSSLTANLYTQYKQGLFCDIILITPDKLKIEAHRCVLASRSKYFKNLFKGTLMEDDQHKKILHLKSVTNTILQNLIDFIYTGNMVMLDDGNVEEMLNASELLQLKDVQSECVQFLFNNVNDTTCLVFKDIGDARRIPILPRMCLNYALQHFDSVSYSEEFLNTNVRNVLKLIKSNRLCTDDEENVFMAIIDWVKCDKKRRKNFLPILLKYLRLPTTYELYDMISHEPLIKADPRCMKILRKAYKYHLNMAYRGIIPCYNRPRNCQMVRNLRSRA